MEQPWWRLRMTAAAVYVEFSGTFATLFATDVAGTVGPPLALRLSLERNLNTRDGGLGTFEDATALAETPERLDMLQVSDAHILRGVNALLRRAGNRSMPWRLLVRLEGEHEFLAEAEYSGLGGHGTLTLRLRPVLIPRLAPSPPIAPTSRPPARR